MSRNRMIDDFHSSAIGSENEMSNIGNMQDGFIHKNETTRSHEVSQSSSSTSLSSSTSQPAIIMPEDVGNRGFIPRSQFLDFRSPSSRHQYQELSQPRNSALLESVEAIHSTLVDSVDVKPEGKGIYDKEWDKQDRRRPAQTLWKALKLSSSTDKSAISTYVTSTTSSTIEFQGD